MTKKTHKEKQKTEKTPRFGIGEWFGYDISKLTPERRREFANEVLKPKKDRKPQLCPFRPQTSPETNAVCTKDGGVCSLRLYEYQKRPDGRAMGVPVDGEQGEFRVTCPQRFYEDNLVLLRIGEEVLQDKSPLVVTEVGFLEAAATEDSEGGDDVGRIDMVLLSNSPKEERQKRWVTVEIQAVYFSGQSMRGEFETYRDEGLTWLAYPAGHRRPDYRSSAPKRLMPQLQIKVPTLRRWGKKMAVVVDRAFFNSIGKMDEVGDMSNSDIVWVVVRVDGDPNSDRTRMSVASVKCTTLERAVDGLTGGHAVSMSTFEKRVLAKISNSKE